MTHTHAEIIAAMSDADVALNALINNATSVEDCRRFAVLAIALRMACQRLAEVENAMKHKGLWN
jgi:hypothetical protein